LSSFHFQAFRRFGTTGSNITAEFKASFQGEGVVSEEARILNTMKLADSDLYQVLEHSIIKIE
jgi:hypothetical protein